MPCTPANAMLISDLDKLAAALGAAEYPAAAVSGMMAGNWRRYLTSSLQA